MLILLNRCTRVDYRKAISVSVSFSSLPLHTLIENHNRFFHLDYLLFTVMCLGGIFTLDSRQKRKTSVKQKQKAIQRPVDVTSWFVSMLKNTSLFM